MDEKNDIHRFQQMEVIGETPRKSGNRERICWIVLVLLLIAAVIGVSVYFTQNYEKKGDDSESGKNDAQNQGTTRAPPVTVTTKATTAAPTTSKATTTTKATTAPPTDEELQRRTDCIPEAQGMYVKATQELCAERGCVYEESSKSDVPVCFFKPDQGYKVSQVSETALGFRVDLERKSAGPFGDDWNTAVFSVEMLGNDIIHFQVRLELKIYVLFSSTTLSI